MLNKETKAIIDKISKADGSHNIAANVVFHTTGVMLSRNNIHYLSGLCNDLEELDGITKKNSTEKMMHYLKRKKFNHMVLYHDGKHNELLNICDNSSTQRMDLPPEEKADVDHFIKTHWNAFSVQHNKSLFIGLAWVIPMEQKLFHHFPEVICVDTVNQTNKDKRPLLTISGRDTHGKMFIILRAFLPNERAWLFCWIFSLVLPTLFPSYVLSQVKAIITDGCPQEFTQIDYVRNTTFKNALRRRCGFHLVRMGWAVHVIKKILSQMNLDHYMIMFVII